MIKQELKQRMRVNFRLLLKPRQEKKMKIS